MNNKGKIRISLLLGILALVLIFGFYAEYDAEAAREGGLHAQYSGTDTVTYMVSIATGSTEFSQALPAGAKSVKIQNDTAQATYIAWATAKVATPTSPYWTVKSGGVYEKDDLYFEDAKTIYFSSTPSGCNVQLEVTY